MIRFTTQARLKVSIAKQSDRPLITRLSRRAIGPSDYVLRILPSVVARGGLFLAWEGSELVGMTNFDKCIDGSGWLSMARTDPNWRRRGVATLLQRKIAAYARRRGVRTLRLLVSSENMPSLKACEKGGFKRVCEVAHTSCKLRTRRPRGKVGASSISQTQLQSLLKSRYLAKTGGYIGYRRHFVKLTKRLLTRLCNEGELYLVGASAFLVSRPERSFRGLQSSSAILQGPMGKSLILAKEVALRLGARILRCHTPYSAYEISVARGLGFTSSPWGKHCVLFEKKI